MDLELVKFINSDLTWTSVKKGHRTMKKRPKKPTTSNSDVTAFDYEKSGVAILGQHFGEEVLDVPIKKRILMLQSQLPAAHHELTEKSKNKSTPIAYLNDFSGIELLAAAASVYEEHSTPKPTPTPTSKVESYTECAKDEIAPVASDDSSVQDPHSEKGDKTSEPSKDVRFNWDLNIVMDEWEQEQEQEEEQCCDILVDPHSEKGYSKDNSKNEEENIKSCEITNSGDQEQVQEQEQEQEQVKSVSEVVQGDDDDKVISEDRLSDCCGSNTVDKVEKTTGYESPVEDGELRDTWQKEDEVEEMECVDYESDNIYEDNFDTIESSNNETTLDHQQKIGTPNNEVQQGDKINVPNKHSQSANSQEKDRISRKFLQERKNVNLIDSCIPRTRSDNFGDSYSRGKRDFGQEKSMYNGWDSRNSQRYSSRPKHVIGSRNSQPVSYNPRGSYKTFNTRQERNNESYRGTGKIQPSRDNSRERFKSELGFHLRREEYNSERKVSSFSHISRSRRRSRSRSRSESPIAWNFQKKRNVETKIESQDYNKADTRFHGDKRASFQENLGRLKSSDNSRSGRFPQGNGQHDGQYGTGNGGGRFRYSVDESLSFKTRNKDSGFRYGRNENRYFKDATSEEKAYRYHKDDFQRE